MTPLRVALVNRASSLPGERMAGWWAYAVPEFTVTRYPVGRGFCLSRDDLSQRHDVVVIEDGKLWGEIGGKAWIPVCYLVTDSTLSEEHYQHRLRQAEQADLILVDWDRLERFEGLGKPVRRWSYCVNDLIFRDYGQPKTVDVAFHASTKGCPGRAELSDWLAGFCQSRGYSYACGRRLGTEYALSFNRAKVVVDLGRSPETRNHRTFDVMASRACLLTSPLPEVGGEHFAELVHYAAWLDYPDLESRLDFLLHSNDCLNGAEPWRQIADRGFAEVMAHHTWRVRAAELRATLVDVFPQLREEALACSVA